MTYVKAEIAGRTPTTELTAAPDQPAAALATDAIVLR
jgi:hypothetical protein